MSNAGLRRSIGACDDAELVRYVHFACCAGPEAWSKTFQFISNDIDSNYSSIL